jgi:alkanesulfonate monooxygenase SsuD/methylene tetrahydromethanopterin reductase-like flavin-dependent oxidoreductase (luciferase family)
VQRPHPPILIGGRSDATLRVVARHADVWNIPGGDIADSIARSARLDELCGELGRDPGEIARSMLMGASYDDPAATRHAIAQAVGGGFQTIVLGLRPPYPANVARWVAEELIPAG